MKKGKDKENGSEFHPIGKNFRLEDSNFIKNYYGLPQM